MVLRGTKTLRLWMFIYIGLAAAIAFADKSLDMTYADISKLSPVAISTYKPLLPIDALVRRSDI